jgi:hypothetical protein
MTVHNQPEGRDRLVDRATIVKVLQHVGLDSAKIDAVLEGLEFPADAVHLAEKLSHLGVTRDRLMDRMGASP